MTGQTHVAMGALAGAAVMRLSGHQDLTLVLVGAAGGLLPDVDIPGSRAQRRLVPFAAATVFLSHFAGIQTPRPLSFVAWAALAFTLAGMLGRHRGVTHSALAVAVTALAAIAFSPSPHGAALTLGIATHILLDTITPEGTSLLWPSRRRVSVPTARTGSIADVATGLLAAAATALLAAR